MTTKTRLTPGQRLTRGLTYTVVGPVDITRGALGLGAASAQSTVRRLRREYETGQLSKEVAAAQDAIVEQITAAQEAVANLPQVLAEVRKPKRRRRRGLWIAAGGAVVLAGGAVAFSIVRRSMQPEPSPLPPSVEVEPKP